MHHPVVRVLLVSLLAASVQGNVPGQVDSELSAYVAARRKVMDDPSRAIGERETVALEIAATLDRAAWSSNSAETRRNSWAEARAILDGFSSRNPNHPRSRMFAFQAGVYLWAEAQSWTRGAESGDPELKARAISTLDGALVRFRQVARDLEDSDDSLAQNVRYRLSRSLLDRARLEPDRPSSPSLKQDALRILDSRPIRETSLLGYATLLRADLLAEASRFDEAIVALNQSSKAANSPPTVERLSVLIPILAGRGEFDAGLAEIASSNLSSTEKQRLRLRLAIARRASMKPGEERLKREAECFQIAADLRSSEPNDFLGAVRELAAAIDQPSPTLPAESWAILAEGAAALHQPDRASRLDVIAAAKAEGRGDLDSARRWRFRAAGICFSAKRYAQADLLFSQIVQDPDAGRLRPKAGMLRALSRYQALNVGESGLTKTSYVTALTEQIRDFPDDPATGEALWLLGRVKDEEGSRPEAKKLWESVPRTHARWLDARLGFIHLLKAELDEKRLVETPEIIAKFADSVRLAISATTKEAREDSEKTDLELESIGLELTPGVGDPKRALNAVERLKSLPLNPDQRTRTEVLRIVALAVNERFLEAEKATAQLATSPDSRIDLARKLDVWATTLKTDRIARRVGYIERIVADRLASERGLTPPQISEIRLRRARGRMLSGDFDGARSLLKDWSDPIGDVPGSLSEVADLFEQVGNRDRAIDAFRSLSHRSPAGSPVWLLARLGHARALLAIGQFKAARQILEGTSLLHPELGGPAMKQEYRDLSAKIDRR